MNQHLKKIQDLLQQRENLDDADKEGMIKAIADADKQWSITDFKLDRTEKVKKTTAILLEETISELEQKRKAIEQKNRELEIESALERVRSVAMGMKKPEDMLDVCKTIAHQLEQLKVKEIRNVQTAIFNDEKGFYTNYEYYARHDKLFITDTNFRDHPVAEEFANRMMKGPNEVFVHGFQGQEVKDWLEYQKGTNVFIDTYLETAESLTYHWYSLGPVAMGISTYVPLKDEEIELFKRFRNVFELAYRRYLDIQKAEAQAREAEIELALERVRARTMAMQRSEELRDAAALLFQQAQALGARSFACGFSIWGEEKKTATFWMAQESMIQPPFTANSTEDVFHEIYQAAQRAESLYIKAQEGKELEAHYRYMSTIPIFKGIMEKMEQAGLSVPTFQILHCAFFSQGFLLFITYEPVQEMWDVFKRFSKVFEQTYTRFLDLQKAEAQAREGQIQLALERVRARTMAMQKSDELMEAANLLFQQVRSLEIPVWSCGYNIWEKGEKVCTGWMSTQGVIQPSFRIPLTEHRTFIHMNESRLKEEPFYVEEVSGEELADHYRYMFSLPDFKEIATKQLRNGFTLPLTQINHVFNFKHGNLIFLSAEALPEALDIFKRFTAVFEQTYTRFLDLQKAEAQAREAQIEAALEKVRSASLAMHHSDELEKVVVALFDKLLDLGIPFHGALIYLFEKEKKNIQLWVASNVNPTIKVNLPYDAQIADNPIVEDLWTALEEKKDVVNRCYTGKVKNDYYRYVAKYNESKIHDSVKEMMLAAESWTVSFAAENNSAIGIDSFAGGLTNQEDFQVVKRFAKVFEQAYTRFLDLQKAETQAREAKIEAALERVRARAMAMHKSEELKEVALELRKQMGLLDQKELETCAIHLYDEDPDHFQSWAALRSPNSEGEIIQTQSQFPIRGVKIIDEMMECYRSNKHDYVLISEGAKAQEFLGILKQYAPKAFEVVSTSFTGLPPENIKAYWSVADFTGGSLVMTSMIEPDENSRALLRRFANVFGLAYRRFTDLKNAEAQARESQVQLALERARTQSMIMQHSKELDDTLRVFHEQVLSLDIPSAFSFLWLPDEEKDRHIFWAAWAENNSFKSKAINYALDRNDPATAQCLVDWKSNEPVVAYHVPPEGVATYFAAWSELITGVEQLKPEYFNDGLYYVEAFMKYGCFGVMVRNTLSEDEKKMLSRFAVEFERTYTRFLDLQKAEAQAREAEIELSLERVRSKAMAMHTSGDILSTTTTAFEELKKLGVHSIRCGIGLLSKNSMEVQVYASTTDSNGVFQTLVGTRNMNDHPSLKRQYQSWLKQENLVVALSDEELESYYHKLFFQSSASSVIPQNFENKEYGYYFSFADGLFYSWSDQKYAENEISILNRFKTIVALTFRRFLDLQKAEAQARESQIEAALERVRSRTMAMQQSGELADIVGRIFGELRLLDLVLNRVLIWIFNDEEKYISWWSANPEVDSIAESYRIDYNDQPVFLSYLQAWQNRTPLHLYALSGEAKKKWEDHLFSNTHMAKLPTAVREGMRAEGTIFTASTISDYGLMMVGSFEQLSNENIDIIQRFGRVFQQSYTRYLDVQKAEAQARESQIETALERVRSRSMGMQKSDELKEVIQVVYEQFVRLKINLDHAGFVVDYKPKGDWHFWIADKQEIPSRITHPYFDSVWAKQFNEAKEKGIDFFATNLNFEEKNKFYNDLFSYVPGLPEETKEFYFKSPGVAVSNALLENVALYIENFSGIPYTDEENRVLMRFGKVFQQTYTRFLDLQKAEAQVREALIEAALERVRSRSLAMHRSDELQEVVHTVFERLKELNVQVYTAIIIIFTENSKDIVWWMQNKINQQYSRILIKYTGIPYLEDLFDAKEKGKELFSKCYVGEEKFKLYDYLFRHTDLKTVPENQKKFLLENEFASISVAFSKNTAIHLTSYSERSFSDEDNETLKRFAKVFDQAYTRFIDLQKSEAQAREAQIEAALERVRSRTLAMQRSDELAETAAVLFQQLILLGIEPNRLYINIVKDETGDAEFWITDEDGSKIAMAYSVNMNANPIFKKMYEGWQAQNKSLILDMQGTELSEYFKFLASLNVPFKGGLSQQRRLQYIVYFSKGFIGMASPDEQPAETMQLLERFAAVFNLTFTRFNDLKIAEAHALKAEQDLVEIKAARKHAEEALVELQATQKQLIQSEKMASLGELTAGIAHEIQNPLNFVNNFSDVSNELIEELKIKNEKLKIDDEEIKELLSDITQNLEKISHHGKRADAIVKGMLQHSRTSSSQKELTDINTLADEYLRLAYHGLRAKDKSFNAKFITDFDKNVTRVNIIPQEIGRVILNLINNAFYAVNERKKVEGAEYEPTVAISTASTQPPLGGRSVQIKVTDNGGGIPQKNLAKIFQPFFTTKPTGQGTGLGLSLAYDIVTKGHNGEIKVETVEGEGSEFIIELPVV